MKDVIFKPKLIEGAKKSAVFDSERAAIDLAQMVVIAIMTFK